MEARELVVEREHGAPGREPEHRRRLGADQRGDLPRGAAVELGGGLDHDAHAGLLLGLE